VLGNRGRVRACRAAARARRAARLVSHGTCHTQLPAAVRVIHSRTSLACAWPRSRGRGASWAGAPPWGGATWRRWRGTCPWRAAGRAAERGVGWWAGSWAGRWAGVWLWGRPQAGEQGWAPGALELFAGCGLAADRPHAWPAAGSECVRVYVCACVCIARTSAAAAPRAPSGAHWRSSPAQQMHPQQPGNLAA
jgi:hypothetical protein